MKTWRITTEEIITKKIAREYFADVGTKEEALDLFKNGSLEINGWADEEEEITSEEDWITVEETDENGNPLLIEAVVVPPTVITVVTEVPEFDNSTYIDHTVSWDNNAPGKGKPFFN